MRVSSHSPLRLASIIRLQLAITSTFVFLCGCINHGQRNTNQIHSFESPLDSTQAIAFLEFQECISVVDSNIHAWSKMGAPGELIPISKVEARSCIFYAKRASEYAIRALEIIAPYDSTFCEPARMISELADLGCFYANKYLDGEGEAYADKCQVQAGHAAAFLQDIQYGLSNTVLNAD